MVGLPIRIDTEVEQHLIRLDKFAPDYYLDNMNVFTEQQISRKVRNTGNHEFILIRAKVLDEFEGLAKCNWEYDWAHLERFLTILFKYPMKLERRNHIPFHACRITQYVVDHFRVVDEVEGHYLMRRASDLDSAYALPRGSLQRQGAGR